MQTNVAQTTNYYTQFPFTGLIASQKKVCLHPTCGSVDLQLSMTVNCYQNPSGSCADPNAPPSAITITSTDINRYFPAAASDGRDEERRLDGSALPKVTTTYQYDCDTSNPCYGLSKRVTVVTSQGADVTCLNSSNACQDTTNTYQTADTDKWFVDRLTQSAVAASSAGTTITRTSGFSYDATTGLLLHETVEPGDAGCFYLDTGYQYDAYGNKNIVTLTPRAACGASRKTETDYAPALNGAFVTHDKKTTWGRRRLSTPTIPAMESPHSIADPTLLRRRGPTIPSAAS